MDLESYPGCPRLLHSDCWDKLQLSGPGIKKRIKKIDGCSKVNLWMMFQTKQLFLEEMLSVFLNPLTISNINTNFLDGGKSLQANIFQLNMSRKEILLISFIFKKGNKVQCDWRKAMSLFKQLHSLNNPVSPPSLTTSFIWTSKPTVEDSAANENRML